MVSNVHIETIGSERKFYTEKFVKELKQKIFVLETAIKAYENLTNLLEIQSEFMLSLDGKLNQIFKLCLDEKHKSNKEIARIRDGFLNPNTSMKNLAIGCEYDIQKVLDKISKIIIEDGEGV